MAVSQRIKVDLTGLRFGRLTVAAEVFRPGGRKRRYWQCVCGCGTDVVTEQSNLMSGHSTSCGCYHKQRTAARSTRHGAAGRGRHAPEYDIWWAVLARCTNPNQEYFADYGGRGITVCARWRNSYPNFIGDMGSRPKATHSIDRIDNDAGYWCGRAECPECGPAGRVPNCRWATRRQQSRNTRVSRRLTIGDRTMALVEWAEEKGISASTLRTRLSAGWPVERAVNAPVRR
jgi:hypothetical protein